MAPSETQQNAQNNKARRRTNARGKWRNVFKINLVGGDFFFPYEINLLKTENLHIPPPQSIISHIESAVLYRCVTNLQLREELLLFTERSGAPSRNFQAIGARN